MNQGSVSPTAGGGRRNQGQKNHSCSWAKAYEKSWAPGRWGGRRRPPDAFAVGSGQNVEASTKNKKHQEKKNTVEYSRQSEANSGKRFAETVEGDNKKKRSDQGLNDKRGRSVARVARILKAGKMC